MEKQFTFDIASREGQQPLQAILDQISWTPSKCRFQDPYIEFTPDYVLRLGDLATGYNFVVDSFFDFTSTPSFQAGYFTFPLSTTATHVVNFRLNDLIAALDVSLTVEVCESQLNELQALNLTYKF